ncbi:MAG TPA: protein phosphatase 2C domain-containing protein [Gemmatimonadaceae bacterium]|nr:protein phosphatase 2C domain-containing protein [Gemmatimonadaceae bacterium]
MAARPPSGARCLTDLHRTPAPPDRSPRDDEIDVHGLTHVGKVRRENQDQFLIASFHKQVHVLASSLGADHLPPRDTRLGVVAMVADGVGGGEGGAEASSTALETAMRYVDESMACFYRAGSHEQDLIDALQAAASHAHDAIRGRKSASGRLGTMATTLTLWMGVWPAYYLLQVGDSRYYHYRHGTLTQVSRDQTIAQELVDEGVMSRTAAFRTQFANVLSSALGADHSMPVVTRLQSEWNTVHLLCSDGLTKHVSDDRIAERLANMTGARQVAEQLLQDALDGGGTDNITIIVGRAVPGSP